MRDRNVPSVVPPPFTKLDPRAHMHACMSTHLRTHACMRTPILPRVAAQAFIKLESMPSIPADKRESFGDLAMSIFLKHPPADPRALRETREKKANGELQQPGGRAGDEGRRQGGRRQEAGQKGGAGESGRAGQERRTGQGGRGKQRRAGGRAQRWGGLGKGGRQGRGGEGGPGAADNKAQDRPNSSAALAARYLLLLLYIMLPSTLPLLSCCAHSLSLDLPPRCTVPNRTAMISTGNPTMDAMLEDLGGGREQVRYIAVHRTAHSRGRGGGEGQAQRTAWRWAHKAGGWGPNSA